jgi:excisionase family DNA binding protein
MSNAANLSGFAVAAAFGERKAEFIAGPYSARRPLLTNVFLTVYKRGAMGGTLRMEKLLSVAEAAEKLGVDRTRINQLIDSGDLLATRIRNQQVVGSSPTVGPIPTPPPSLLIATHTPTHDPYHTLTPILTPALSGGNYIECGKRFTAY